MTKVSVIMPVYNGQAFLAESVKSILNQTHPFLELVIVDDASVDSTSEIIKEFASGKIIYLRNDRNLGVAESLNRGICHSTGEYIARMDADDIALPNRLKKQVNYLEQHQEIGVCGTWVRFHGRYEGIVEKRPVGPGVLKAFLMLDNPLMHPTVVMRRRVFDAVGVVYDRRFERCEDFELWERLAAVTAIDNIPEPLLRYRVHDTNVTTRHLDEVWEKSCEVLARSLARIGVAVGPDQLRFHRRVCHGEPAQSLVDLKAAENWLVYLGEQNQLSSRYGKEDMDAALAFCWYRLCRNSSALGQTVWKLFRTSTLSKCPLMGWREKSELAAAIAAHFLLKAIRRKSRWLVRT